MLGSDFPPNALSPKNRGGPSVFLHLYLEDANAAFDRAVKAGCTIKMPVSDTFWGDRYGVVEDPFGHQCPSPRTNKTSRQSSSPPTPKPSWPRC